MWDDLPDPELFRVLAVCKVRTRRGGSPTLYGWVDAWPLEAVPAVMTRYRCWQGDHWRFTNDVPSTVLSVYDTWVFTGVDTWQEDAVCLLELQNRGFLFQKLDVALLESGAGI